MSKTVHILNGDSTAFAMKESGLSGDIIVWREMLCEGPVSKNIGDDDFWSLRYSFFEDELDVNRLDYYDKTIKELVKIEDISNYTEVVLWFEYDLFCQINLMGLCTYLLNHFRKNLSYYLVCVGKDQNRKGLQTLSDYSPKEYKNLYNQKIKLSHQDLLFVKECWTTYVVNDIQELKEFNFNKNGKFKYFELAMNQHLKRFSENEKLNQIDHKLIKTIHTYELTEKDLIRELLFWQKQETVYGFGDLQYVKYLRKLHPFYEIKNNFYYLNDKGKSFLATK